ncbi:MAG: hypothetical protein IJ644_06160 [Oscillospiraceae bacterium]|nr:hypothetical protein [Oscillospiraceae bacterium]
MILEPFCGSGTTAVSAMKFGRKFVMIERSQAYCELAKARINGKEGCRNA